MDRYSRKSVGCTSLIKSLAASQMNKKQSPKKSAQKYISSNSNGYRGYSNVFGSESYGTVYSRSCLIESHAKMSTKNRNTLNSKKR